MKNCDMILSINRSVDTKNVKMKITKNHYNDKYIKQKLRKKKIKNVI
jgi:hypothetical protein